MTNKEFNQFFWPTDLALRLPHCYAPHGAKCYADMPHLEHPPWPNRRGPRIGRRKRLRYQRIFRDLDLPF